MSDKPAVATPAPKSLKDWLGTKEFKDQVALALPKHITPDRLLRVALTSINRNPAILKCTKESVLQCILDCSAMGLEPDGRRAHLIPFGTTCSLILDYKGIAELVRNSGDVSYIHADVVGSDDNFDYAHGTGAFLKHKPNLKDRGKIICAYSFVRLKDGSEDFDVMSVDEIEKIRARSRAKDSGPWVTDWNEMAKKSVFRRHSKWLPLSPELREKLDKDLEHDPAIDVEATQIRESKLITKDLSAEKGIRPAEKEDDLIM